jgi:ribose 1,5-bisphosphokinase
MEAALIGLVVAPRLVTRAGQGNQGDLCLSRESFLELSREGRLALSWESHGHLYGIGKEIEAMTAQGLTVIVNGSREYYPQARERYPDLVPVLVTASPESLKARLENRAREDSASIAERLSRTNESLNLPLGGLVAIDNSGDINTASERFISLLRGFLNRD